MAALTRSYYYAPLALPLYSIGLSFPLCFRFLPRHARFFRSTLNGRHVSIRALASLPSSRMESIGVYTSFDCLSSVVSHRAHACLRRKLDVLFGPESQKPKNETQQRRRRSGRRTGTRAGQNHNTAQRSAAWHTAA
jgi:hypothetical protein